MISPLVVLLLFCALLVTSTTTISATSSPSYPPGFYTAWTFGRIWWHNDSSVYQFPVGNFDNSGTAFCVLSVGGGQMNLTGLGVEMMVNPTTNWTTNQPHYFGAYLFEYDSADQLPSDPNQLMLPPPLEKATKIANFTTESWTNSSARYLENIFEISDPSKTYLMWLIKLTEADWNRRWPQDNFVTFVSFSLTRQLPSTSSLISSTTTTTKTPVHIPKYQDPSQVEISSMLQTSSSNVGTSSPYSRRIQFLGDSITAGYCNNCIRNPDLPNGTTLKTSYANESYIKTWDFLLAQTLQAEYHTIAWSGMGMARNYNGEGVLHFPDIFRRTCASTVPSSSACGSWIFPPHQNTSTTTQPFLPQVVVSNLGTNDFADVNETTNATLFANISAKYVANYQQVLVELAILYGKQLRAEVNEPLYLFMACGPMDERFCTLIEQVKSWWDADISSIAKFVDITIIKFPKLASNVTACGHPNTEGDKIMMEYCEKTIRDKTGWKKN